MVFIDLESEFNMLLIKNGRVVDPKSGFDQVADVLVDGKKVVKIADAIEEAGAEVIDATGLVVAPGLVDIHVHFREPGQTHKEDIHTGALAAAAGGFTSVVMMANTNPTISDVETLKEVLASAAKENVHVYTNATVTKNFDGKTLTDFKALLENGALSFSDDGIPLQSTKVLKEALDLAKANNTFVAVHEEDPELNGILGFNEGIARDKFHFCGATGVAEYSMIARDVMIAYDRGAHLHIQHLSKAESVKVVEFAQQLGANVTAEAAPQHFSKTEDLLLIKGSAAKMNPPLRTEKDRLAVIEGLKSGVISVIATDHAPHHADEKNVDDITKAPSGMTGLETSLSLGLTNLVATGDLTLSELLAKMTINPSSMYDFDAGYLAENGPADIVIFTDKEERVVSDHFASKASNSPFIGEKLQGVVKYTICDGNIVYKA
ncbi:dihydroorotase [Streptococcus infantarius subsp. infantarius]|nr:dihydroorotase [Streptococcus infantarius subsp. infantarius]MCO4563930.1 dihydroorotase [Streptococcus infantarius subsp. infantarius]